MNCDELSREIETNLGCLLSDFSLQLDDAREIEGDGCELTYRSPRRLVRFYSSPRNGEINCLVTDDISESADERRNWRYVRDAAGWRADWTDEQLEAEPHPGFRSVGERLVDLGDRLSELSWR